MTGERDQLESMSNQELASYHNILTMSSVMLAVSDDPGRTARHLGMVDSILKGRGVPVVAGRLTIRG